MDRDDLPAPPQAETGATTSATAVGEAPFRTQIRGYDRGEVDAHLARLREEVDGAGRARDELAAKVEELSRALTELRKHDGDPWKFAVCWRGFMTKAQAWL
jgi:DivIVA domain-containing protein